MAKHKLSLPIKSAALGIAFIIAFIFIAGYFTAALKNLDYFKIKDIIANKPQEAFDFSYLSGRNIFSIDLKKESRYISEQYPVYKNIKLFRLFPSRLFINFADRKAIAYVKMYRYFCVDSERVLFDLPQGREAEGLPVIIGLERKGPGPRPGRQCNIKELIAALNIIKEAETNGLLRKYIISRIDIANSAGISCFIRMADYTKDMPLENLPAVEIRMGQNDIGEKIRVLVELFTQLNDDISNIKYIDLRFKEAVVKFKDAT